MKKGRKAEAEAAAEPAAAQSRRKKPRLAAAAAEPTAAAAAGSPEHQVDVVCGDAKGTYDSSKDSVLVQSGSQKGSWVTRAAFVGLGGRKSHDFWKAIKVAGPDGQPGGRLGRYLEERGQHPSQLKIKQAPASADETAAAAPTGLKRSARKAARDSHTAEADAAAAEPAAAEPAAVEDAEHEPEPAAAAAAGSAGRGKGRRSAAAKPAAAESAAKPAAESAAKPAPKSPAKTAAKSPVKAAVKTKASIKAKAAAAAEAAADAAAEHATQEAPAAAVEAPAQAAETPEAAAAAAAAAAATLANAEAETVTDAGAVPDTDMEPAAAAAPEPSAEAVAVHPAQEAANTAAGEPAAAATEAAADAVMADADAPAADAHTSAQADAPVQDLLQQHHHSAAHEVAHAQQPVLSAVPVSMFEGAAVGSPQLDPPGSMLAAGPAAALAPPAPAAHTGGLADVPMSDAGLTFHPDQGLQEPHLMPAQQGAGHEGMVQGEQQHQAAAPEGLLKPVEAAAAQQQAQDQAVLGDQL